MSPPHKGFHGSPLPHIVTLQLIFLVALFLTCYHWVYLFILLYIYLPISMAIPWGWLMTRWNGMCVYVCMYIPLYIYTYTIICIYVYIFLYNELINLSNVTELFRVEKEFQHILDSNPELLDSHQCCLLICSFFPFLLSSYHIPITFLSSEKGKVSKVAKEPSSTV